MKKTLLFAVFQVALFLLLFITQGHAQRAFDEKAFGDMSKAQRFQFIHDSLTTIPDSAAFMAWYTPMMAVSTLKKDQKSVWLLRYSYFHFDEILKLAPEEIQKVAVELEESARSNHYTVEQIVAEYYLQYEKAKQQKSTYEQQYAEQLRLFDRMEAIGFDQFKDYGIEIILFQCGEFMYRLKDYDKALQFLLVAERFIAPTQRGYYFYVLVLNYIQSAYEEQSNEQNGDYSKCLEYEHKLLHFTQTFKSDNIKTQRFCLFWQGFTLISLAKTYCTIKNNKEGELYADQGYQLVLSLYKKDPKFEQALPEVLNVLLQIKIALKKFDEAEQLIHKLEESIKNQEKLNEPPRFFQNYNLYKNYIQFYKGKEDFALAEKYQKLFKPLQDSLDRRNNIRKLESIQKLQLAEKYNLKLTLIEEEARIQKNIRNGILVFLFLVLLGAFLIFRKIQTKRRQAMVALTEAEKDLESSRQSTQEQSELVGKLSHDIEKIAQSDQHQTYIEQLTHSTILTEENWIQFRALFEKAHPGFIENLKTTYPDLTPAETRLLVLEKLDLSLQEMANILGVSKNTIHQTRFRLRRKIDGH